MTRPFTIASTNFPFRSESKDEQKPVSLVKTLEIPRQPKKPTPASEEMTNGHTSAGRKRDAETAGLTNGDNERIKRVASESVTEAGSNGDGDGDGANPIIVDEEENGGAILIDD